MYLLNSYHEIKYITLSYCYSGVASIYLIYLLMPTPAYAIIYSKLFIALRGNTPLFIYFQIKMNKQYKMYFVNVKNSICSEIVEIFFFLIISTGFPPKCKL